MPRGERRISIARAPKEVFDFVADPTNDHLWHAHVGRTHWLDANEPMAPGRRGRQASRLSGRSERSLLLSVTQPDG